MAPTFLPAFFPVFTTHELRGFTYTASDGSGGGMVSVFSYDMAQASMVYANYKPDGEWINSWYYVYKPGFGIAETKDTYPGGKKWVFSTPIGWGEFINIGSTYSNHPVVDPLRSWPPTITSGSQYVVYEALHPSFTISNGANYPNVLQLSGVQKWGSTTSGIRYWLAQGLGPIAFEFLTPQSCRFDAVGITRNGA